MADPAKDPGPAPVGGWYASLCRSVGGTFRPLTRPDVRTAALQKKFELSRVALRQAEDAVARQEMTETARSPTLRRLERRARTAKARADNLERLLKRTEFRRELYFAGLDVTPDEVHTTAVAMFFVTFIILLAVAVISIAASGFVVGIVAALVFLPVLVVPLALYMYIYNYPVLTSQRLRIQTLGRAPEAVHYMVMSMRLNPSLDRAVRFSSENLDEPLAGSLKKVLWDVYTRTYASIEDSFMAFAEEWGHWNEDFKRAMYSIRMATLERTEEGLSRNLEKALESILTGTKKRIEDFAAGLQGPTTVLFGLGILLPMIIGAMLPMIFLTNLGSSFTNPAAATPTAGSTSSNPLGAQPLSPGTTLLINVGFILLMDLVFPLVAYIYSDYIVAKRPGTLRVPNPPHVDEDFSPAVTAVFAILVGVAITCLTIPAYFGLFGSTIFEVSPLFVIVGIGAGTSVYLYMSTRQANQARKALLRLEAEFPDALFQVGNRMAEGLPLERALDRTAEAMAGSETALLFRRILHGIRVSGQPPEQVIFGGTRGEGVLELYPSRMIAVSMRALLEAVTKGPEAVGHTIVPMSQYLKELREVDETIQVSMKPTVSMMKGTAYVFSPLVLGMTGALYVLLSQVLTGNILAVSIPIFFAGLGIYLIEMVLVINYFTIGVEQGGDKVGYKVLVGESLGLATAIFLMASILGLIVVGAVGSGGI